MIAFKSLSIHASIPLLNQMKVTHPTEITINDSLCILKNQTSLKQKSFFQGKKKAPRRGFVKTQTLLQRSLANDEISQQDMHAIFLPDFS